MTHKPSPDNCKAVSGLAADYIPKNAADAHAYADFVQKNFDPYEWDEGGTRKRCWDEILNKPCRKPRRLSPARVIGQARVTIDRNTPMPLEIAARVAFPDDTMTVSGLRTEIRKGNLPASKMAGRIWVTLTDIERMRERCQINVDHSYTCENRDGPVASGDGSSPTAPHQDSASNAPLEHLKMIAQRLRKPSRRTSRQSTSQALAKVIPLKS